MLWDSKLYTYLRKKKKTYLLFSLVPFTCVSFSLSWINDNTGENLTYSLWDYSLKTDPDYMLNFWKINSGFDRAWVKRIDARDGTESGFDLDYEGLEPSGINPIYGGSHDNWYMWPNKSIHGEQMIYFNSRMKNHRNFWMGGDNNFEMSGRGMEPWDTTGYVNAGMENCKIVSALKKDIGLQKHLVFRWD